jgi:hypothetical protein
MEYTIPISVIPHLVDMPTYARLCGIDVRAVQKRMKQKKLAFTKVDDLTLIDTLASPPIKKLPRSYKPGTLIITAEGHILQSLVRVTRLALKNGITPDRFYRAILLGKLKAVMIAGETFISKNDPLIPSLLANYSKTNYRLPQE